MSNDLSEFQRLDKYARFVPELGRRETWSETVDRVMRFFQDYKKFKLPQETWASLRDGLLKKEATPSMRVIQMAGPALERCEVGAFNCAAVALDSVTAFAELLYVLMQGTGCSFSVERQYISRLDEVPERVHGWADHKISDTTEGWCDALRLEMLNNYFGIETAFDYSAIRPAGARLETKGGYASGPGPLKELLEFVREIMRGAAGRRLSSVECHRIACKIAQIVQVGGVRRAATLSHSDLDDESMAVLKNGEFWDTMPELSQANNSAVYVGPLNEASFDREWENLRTSGTGERGIFRRDDKVARRRQVADFLTNPCVTSDTWVDTSEGPRRVRDLSEPFTAAVASGYYQASGFWSTGVKPVFLVTSKEGYAIRATANHEVYTSTGKVSVDQLKPGSKIVVDLPVKAEWGGRGTFAEGWLLGNLFGDGNITEDQANLDHWGEHKYELQAVAKKYLSETVGCRSDCGTGKGVAEFDKVRTGSRELHKLAKSYGMIRREKQPDSDALETSSSDFARGFISGWYDADGSVQGTALKGYSARISSVDKDVLLMGQRMLARLGIYSRIHKRKDAGTSLLPDGRGGMKHYPTQTAYEIIISASSLLKFFERIPLHNPTQNERIAKIRSSVWTPYNTKRFATVQSIVPDGEEEVFDCSVNEINRFSANGLVVSNCGEVKLRSKQFCNLSLAVIRANDDLGAIARKVWLATVWGTLQSALINFKYLGQTWANNCKTERLLGVDLPGADSNRLLDEPNILRHLRDIVVSENRNLAKYMGIQASTGTTVVKPGGNSGVWLGVGHPVNGWHSAQYIRRVRVGRTTPMFRFLSDQGVPHEQESEATEVFDFLVRAPESALLACDMTALDQLERWLHFKENWTEHNPSVTIYVGPDEWDEVRDWVKAHWEKIGGLSFLPRDGGVYRLAPIETVSPERMDELEAAFPKIDWDSYYDYEVLDSTTLGSDFACVGGACTI